jgi:Subtilase family
MTFLRPKCHNDVMRNFLIVAFIGILSACTPPVSLPPELGRVFIASSTGAFELQGQHLNPKSITIGGRVVSILEVNPDGSRVKVQPVVPLPTGEFSVELVNKDDAITKSFAGVTVINEADEMPIAQIGLFENRNKFVVKGQAILIFDATLDLTTLEQQITVNFDIVRKINPVLVGATNLAGRVIWIVQDKLLRPTVAALTELASKTDSVAAITKMRLIGGQPPSLESSPAQKLELQNNTPRVIPNDLNLARVAVLDTGVNSNKVFDLGNNKNLIDTVSSKNFTTENPNDNAIERAPNGAVLSQTNVGHGTGVAGIVAQTLLEQIGIDALQQHADKYLVPVKVCEGSNGRCDALDVALGIAYASSLANIKVINLSLGSRGGSSLIYQELLAASQKGITIVASAGNQGENPSKPVSYPAAFNQFSPLGAAIPGLLGVGSILEDTGTGTLVRTPSSFSSEGAWVNLVAPGEQIRSASAQAFDLSALFTGTSFSAPKVTAVAAMLYAKDLGSTPESIKSKLISSVTPVAGCAISKCGTGALDIKTALAP